MSERTTDVSSLPAKLVDEKKVEAEKPVSHMGKEVDVGKEGNVAGPKTEREWMAPMVENIARVRAIRMLMEDKINNIAALTEEDILGLKQKIARAQKNAVEAWDKISKKEEDLIKAKEGFTGYENEFAKIPLRGAEHKAARAKSMEKIAKGRDGIVYAEEILAVLKEELSRNENLIADNAKTVDSFGNHHKSHAD